MERTGSSEPTAGSRLHHLRRVVVAPRGASILGSATDRHYRLRNRSMHCSPPVTTRSVRSVRQIAAEPAVEHAE